MTLLELTVVILVLLSLISLLFIASRAWKVGADRSANIMNLSSCQKAMRSEQNLKKVEPGATFGQVELEEYIQFPPPVNGVVTYAAGTEITPEDDGGANMNHIWLQVTTLGQVGEKYGHDSYDKIRGW